MTLLLAALMICPEVNHNLKDLAPKEQIVDIIKQAGDGCRQRGFECVIDLMFDGNGIRVGCGDKVEKEGRERR